MLPIHEKTEQGSTSSKAPSALRRKKLADSWDDEASDDMAENDGGIPETIGEALKAAKAEKKRFGKGMKQTKEVEDDGEALELGNGELLMVLKAFTMLQAEFNQKFKAMWA
jgi:ATP-dependent RNA helicase DDX60